MLGTLNRKLFEKAFDQDWSDSNSQDSMDTFQSDDGIKWNSIDIRASTQVELVESKTNSEKFVFSIASPSMSDSLNILEVAASKQEERQEWIDVIRRLAQTASDKNFKSQKLERTMRIAKELSNLIVYCRSVPFAKEKIGNFSEMSSFAEHKAEKWISPTECNYMLRYHQKQFTRVYPKGLRAKSSNFDPIRFWNCGVQMAALNYQTPDRAMQINQARFRQNQSSGYVLRPDFMFDRPQSLIKFDPYDPTTIDCPTISLTLTIISGRHLGRDTSRGYVSPYVEIEIAGIDADQTKRKTNTIRDNGLNPVWNETFSFVIHCKDLAFLRIVVYDEDVFGDARFLGHGTYPVSCLCKKGIKSIPLMNEYSEEMELSALLVKIDIE